MQKAIELWELGFSHAVRRGATVNPFGLARLPLPARPQSADPAAIERYHEHCVQSLASRRDFDSPDYGAQLLAIRSGARGDESSLVLLTAGCLPAQPGDGRSILVRSGLLAGMDFESYSRLAARSQEQTVETLALWAARRAPGFPDYRGYRPAGNGIIVRAMRSRHPGIVFARAAAGGEVDPLTEPDARLFVGLLPHA